MNDELKKQESDFPTVATFETAKIKNEYKQLQEAYKFFDLSK